MSFPHNHCWALMGNDCSMLSDNPQVTEELRQRLPSSPAQRSGAEPPANLVGKKPFTGTFSKSLSIPLLFLSQSCRSPPLLRPTGDRLTRRPPERRQAPRTWRRTFQPLDSLPRDLRPAGVLVVPQWEDSLSAGYPTQWPNGGAHGAPQTSI